MSSKPVVLYVEDDTQSREIMAILLKYDLALLDFTIWPDSVDFEGKVKKLSPLPDIVFLDIHVQPTDGFGMLKILRSREEFRKARVVAVTASVMNEEVQQLRDAGFNGAIAKPIDQDQFPDMFKRIVAGEEVWRIIV
jgi:CheY-like chemotaxis protein